MAQLLRTNFSGPGPLVSYEVGAPSPRHARLRGLRTPSEWPRGKWVGAPCHGVRQEIRAAVFDRPSAAPPLHKPQPSPPDSGRAVLAFYFLSFLDQPTCFGASPVHVTTVGLGLPLRLPHAVMARADEVDPDAQLPVPVQAPAPVAAEYRISFATKATHLGIYFLCNLSLTIYNKFILGKVSRRGLVLASTVMDADRAGRTSSRIRGS